MLREAEEDILAYLSFPREHHSSISSTNAIERVNAEVDRRAKVVGILPNSDSLLRLATAVLQEQHDEWQDGKRHFSQASLALLSPDFRSRWARDWRKAPRDGQIGSSRPGRVVPR